MAEMGDNLGASLEPKPDRGATWQNRTSTLESSKFFYKWLGVHHPWVGILLDPRCSSTHFAGWIVLKSPLLPNRQRKPNLGIFRWIWNFCAKCQAPPIQFDSLTRGMVMAIAARLPLPRASAYDPPMADEGRLDPLGLGSVADRIADSYGRPVRARMRRVRFLSTMALGGLFIPDLAGIEPAVAGDSPDIAFERVVIECLARSNSSDVHLDSGIPGVTKAHAALLTKSRLSARGYLKSPRVFGFFGIYRPLAAALGLNDRSGGTLAPGMDVLEGLQADLKITGLTNFAHGSQGVQLIEWLSKETARALTHGSNAFSPSSPFVETVTRIANPGAAGPEEKKALSALLSNPIASSHPQNDQTYLEILQLINEIDTDRYGDVELVDFLLEVGSLQVQVRMQLVVDFENFARDLTWAFAQYRYLASHAMGGVPGPSALQASDVIATVAGQIGKRYQTVVNRMQQAMDVGVDPSLVSKFSESFGPFAEVSSPSEFIELLMTHHTSIQRNKAPNGKRAWLEDVSQGWAVRPLFSVTEKPERLVTFVHPYRLRAIANFLEDIHV